MSILGSSAAWLAGMLTPGVVKLPIVPTVSWKMEASLHMKQVGSDTELHSTQTLDS